MDTPIINKVAQSGIITLELEKFLPAGEWVNIDLADFLYEGLILREKDFREALAGTLWEQYAGKNIAISCTADAIIPLWAYMLITSYLQPVAETVQWGSLAQAREKALLENLRSRIKPADYEGARIVVKGCGEESVPESAYMEVVRLLQPVAKSIMFGEPCSTVPVFKRK